MLINKLYLNIAIRVILITLSCLVFGFIYGKFNDMIINLNFVLFIALQTFLLIRKLNITNITLTHFFNSIQYDDSSVILKNRIHWKSYQKLLSELDNLNKNITKLKIKSAGQEAYFESLVENVNIGLISIDDKNRILLFNPEARKLLKYREKSPPLNFDNSFPELYNSIKDQKSSEQKLVKISSGKEAIQLLVRKNTVKIIDRQMQLISLQNIRPVLEEKELETWQKMIRVLTHEIMNSISPISSTINTINEFLTTDTNNTPNKPEKVTKETIEDVVRGLHIIQERSTGLIDFVNKFRTLTLLPKPKFENILIAEPLKDVELLLRKELSNKKISFSVFVEPEDIKFKVDPNLLQQMLINIINNSIDALEETTHPSINLKASLQEDTVIIELKDNGQGIPADQIDDIFIPFFSTKEEGSGIGLSLSRQIMRMHGGSITVQSIQGVSTTLTLTFYPTDKLY